MYLEVPHVTLHLQFKATLSKLAEPHWIFLPHRYCVDSSHYTEVLLIRGIN